LILPFTGTTANVQKVRFLVFLFQFLAKFNDIFVKEAIIDSGKGKFEMLDTAICDFTLLFV
jgi:hypothetical protein